MGGFPQVGVDECAVDTLEYYQAGGIIRKGAQPYVVRSYIVADDRSELDRLTEAYFESACVNNVSGESLLYSNKRMDYNLSATALS